jgi:very-short-patch-repair endonuclease
MKKLTTEQFIERARKIHGDKYIYTKTDLDHRDEKGRVCITCPIHGEFWQTPYDHTNGKGCKFCHFDKLHELMSKDTETFVSEAIEVHGTKYDYSITDLKHRDENGKVRIICPIHGEFKINPTNHLQGQGCNKCRNEIIAEKLRLPFEEFFKRAVEIHRNKYIYLKDTYKDTKHKMDIICPIHGKFQQRPNDHLNGHGCPFCKESVLERNINNLLVDNNIKFIKQCRKDNFKWLGRQSLDFYLLEYNTAIECQGEQHFKEKERWSRNGRNNLEHRIKLDERKRKLCEEHGIKLLYFSNKQYEDNVLIDKNKLLEEIKKT